MRRREILVLLGGATIACPRAAVRARQKAMPVIGFLHFASPGPFAYQVDAFRQGLAENGYVGGKSVVVETRWAEGQLERLPALAAEFVAAKVDVIAALGPPAAKAAKRATTTIPIVFLVGIDPVAVGLVASLSHPGGNLTGFSQLAGALPPKRLELLCKLVPGAKSNRPSGEPKRKQRMGGGSSASGAHQGRRAADSESQQRRRNRRFAALADLHADALIEGDAVLFMARREQLVALERAYRVPAIGRFREFADDGGLISYGPDLTDMNRQLGVYAARILSGTRPADLPVQQPTKFQLVVNLNTANALGLTVPPSILARADEVIE